MKRKLLCLFLTLVALLSCLPLCFGTSALSPALSVLANDLVMSKCGLLGNDLPFSAEDFDAMTDAHTESITVLTLPAPESGTLYLADQPIERFTEILRNDLSKLTFRPACDKENACAFTFRQQTPDGKYQAVCTLYMLDRLNFAPTVDTVDAYGIAVECSTYAGIMTNGYLSASDPENDPVTFCIVSYPSKGTVTLHDSEYRYTAFADTEGKDSFSVIAIDRYGNRSEPVPVTVTVLPRRSALSYTDMEGNTAYTAALTLSYCGALSGTVIGGEAVFCPDDPMTQAEFIAALATALDIKPAENVSDVFSNMEDLPPHLIPVIGAAMDNGWIKINEEHAFLANDPITRMEAAKILCCAMELTFEPIPGMEEGEQALLVLASRGILPLCDGALNANEILTRAQGATVICRVLDRI